MNKKAHQHCLLAEHGGAARVRQLLSRELPALGWSVSSSCEVCDFNPAEAEAAQTEPLRAAAGKIREAGAAVTESRGAEAGSGEGEAGALGGEAENQQSSGRAVPCRLDPAELGKTAGLALLCHLHSTADWPLACASLKAAGAPAFPVVITLHDSGLLDGPSLLAGSASSSVTPPAFRPDSSAPPRGEAAVSPQLLALLGLRAWLVSPSAWLAGRLKKAVGCSCRVIPNGVEPNPFDAQTARQRLGLSPNARVVLFAAHGGVLAGLKGAARWPEIWRAVKLAVPAAVGFMVGGESMRRDRDADLLEWPYVDREKMALLTAAADLLIYPSLADNHPLVVLEALSGGTAVSSYCVGGIAEQISPGKTGLLAPAGDEAALIANSIRILSAPGLSREMGRAGRESWERHFRARRMAEKYAALYEQAIGGGKAGGPRAGCRPGDGRQIDAPPDGGFTGGGPHNRCLRNCGLQKRGRGDRAPTHGRERS